MEALTFLIGVGLGFLLAASILRNYIASRAKDHQRITFEGKWYKVVECEKPETEKEEK